MARNRKSWKAVQAYSLLNAFELCLEFARDQRNRSVQQVAELMGLPSHWTLYKWLESGKMPVSLIRPFEHACGCTFVSDWVGLQAGKLVIDMPKARKVNERDIQQLQNNFSQATGLLIDFYNGLAGADETLAAITATLVELAGHRANVSQSESPELDLFNGEQND